MTKFRIPRDGDLDLEFDGTLIGCGHHGTGGSSGYSNDWTRGTDVDIYLTARGSIITAVRQWSKWQGEGEVWRASAHKNSTSALKWLRDDCGGDLGPASKEAWNEACEHPLLKGRDVEVVL